MRPAPDLAVALPPPPAVDDLAPSTPRRRRWLVPGLAAAIAALAIGGYGAYRYAGTAESPWRTSPVVVTDLRQAVSATGALSAVVTVQVGTQVSGVVTELAVDFNDPVKAGQVLAHIDPVILEADVASARANLSSAMAARQQADQELARVQFLAQHDAASQAELETATSAAASAAAQARSARIGVDKSERNLGYATITAPIDGTVVSRLVDVGQTVNAGTTAPTLYTLAGDLHRMQILATVDEADIGQVSTGQHATFTVQAWPNRSFDGTVRQVRLQSTTTDNVVTYTVVVDVDNPDGQLLPGMTANVSFVVAEASQVTAVPAAALRFHPADAEKADGPSVWVVDDGAIHRVPVQVGLTDGTSTEVKGDGLAAGEQVVTGLASAATSSTRSASPFQNSSSGSRQRGPGGGF